MTHDPTLTCTLEEGELADTPVPRRSRDRVPGLVPRGRTPSHPVSGSPVGSVLEIPLSVGHLSLGVVILPLLFVALPPAPVSQTSCTQVSFGVFVLTVPRDHQ